MIKDNEISLKIENGDISYTPCHDLLTAYRFSRILMTAHRLNVFEALGHERLTSWSICMNTGMDHDYGRRFLDTLSEMGLLERTENLYELSEFSRRYFLKGSPFYQGAAIDFEQRLEESWQTLGSALMEGKRVFSTHEKRQEDYEKDLNIYLSAMDNAAVVRASELWNALIARPSGLILDVGAGSGAFLRTFLKMNQGWRALFCDLDDVVARAQKDPGLAIMKERLGFRICNFLDVEQIGRALKSVAADIILISNVIHCQGLIETERMIMSLVPYLAPDGMMVIHDFLTDGGVRGSVYDLHMMLNTMNGRTYHSDEIVRIFKQAGLVRYKRFELPSASSVMVFFRGNET